MAEPTKPKIDPKVLDELVKGVETEDDLNAVMRQLSKGLMERVLEAEMTKHLGHDSGGVVINPEGNVRNGVSKKTLKGDLGQLEPTPSAPTHHPTPRQNSVMLAHTRSSSHNADPSSQLRNAPTASTAGCRAQRRLRSPPAAALSSANDNTALSPEPRRSYNPATRKAEPSRRLSVVGCTGVPSAPSALAHSVSASTTTRQRRRSKARR